MFKDFSPEKQQEIKDMLTRLKCQRIYQHLQAPKSRAARLLSLARDRGYDPNGDNRRFFSDG